MRTPCLALLALVLAGCPKKADTRVAGSDDERLDAAAAHLEELHVRSSADDLSCAERCDLASHTCGVAEDFCAMTEGHPDRTDLPPRCIRAREQCAGAQMSCTRCQAG